MKQNLANRLAAGGVWALQTALMSVEVSRRMQEDGLKVPVGNGSPEQVLMLCGAGAFEFVVNANMDLGRMRVTVEPITVQPEVQPERKLHAKMYDKGGKQISVEEWARLADDITYKRIAYWYSESHNAAVSTVWLGVDPNGCEPPHIFESVVVRAGRDGRPHITFHHRTATEQNAVANHRKLVEAVKNGRL